MDEEEDVKGGGFNMADDDDEAVDLDAPLDLDFLDDEDPDRDG